MNKLLLAIGISSCVLLSACSTNPYGTGKNQGYFSGKAIITSNTANICQDSNGQYAFQGNQVWLAGGQGTSWFTCTGSRQINYSPEYTVYYNIIKNDGTGKNVVAKCTPVFKGKSQQFSNMNLVVQLKSGTPSCQAILS